MAAAVLLVVVLAVVIVLTAASALTGVYVPIIKPRCRVDAAADAHCPGKNHAYRTEAPVELIIPRLLMFICDMPEKRDALCAAGGDHCVRCNADTKTTIDPHKKV